MTSTARGRRTATADELCRDAFIAAQNDRGDQSAGLALVAVGGYGRGELAPHSDLDVVLLHTSEASEVAHRTAQQLWYPLWDAEHRLDHAVRGECEVAAAAAADVRVALGLLDIRHLAGDPDLTRRVRSRVLAGWRRGASVRVPELAQLQHSRHASIGELADTSVPDVKEGDGGLRDAVVLNALAATWLVDVPHGDLERPRQQLLDVRDHLHDLTGRAQDRITPELWEPLAIRLDLPDALAAQIHVRSLGRRISHVSRLVWRRLDARLARPAHVVGGRRPAMQQLAPGVAASAGEVVLGAGARPGDDPALLPRAAAEAAERGLVLNPATAACLTRQCPDLPVPWTDEARTLMVRLLASGRGLFAVWETLDETGALARLLPEWESIRTLPHASTIHRWTVDRHVIETCIGAAALIRDVARPDVLLVAALLHDIGKGQPDNHSLAGEPIAASIVQRMGFAPDAVAQIALLVRHHLLLGDLTTTRDPHDPATAELVGAAVPDTDTLDLLHALTRADACAVSAQAWTPWRARLTEQLVAGVRHFLVEGTSVEPAAPDLPPAVLETALRGGSVLQLDRVGEGPDPVFRLTVAAPDRLGLAADVAELLACARSRVRTARLWTVDVPPGSAPGSTPGSVPGSVGRVGVSEWEVVGAELEVAVLRARFAAIVEGRSVTPARLRVRGAGDLPPRAVVRADAGTRCSVLEIRAADRPGLLHRVLTTLAEMKVSVVSAHASSSGPQAVDVFYLSEPYGGHLSPDRARSVADAVLLGVDAADAQVDR